MSLCQETFRYWYHKNAQLLVNKLTCGHFYGIVGYHSNSTILLKHPLIILVVTAYDSKTSSVTPPPPPL